MWFYKDKWLSENEQIMTSHPSFINPSTPINLPYRLVLIYYQPFATEKCYIPKIRMREYGYWDSACARAHMRVNTVFNFTLKLTLIS